MSVSIRTPPRAPGADWPGPAYPDAAKSACADFDGATRNVMSLRQGDIVIDCADHEAVVPFWEAALG